MTKQMGFIKDNKTTKVVEDFDVDGIKAHRLIIGGTGSGKTTSYINNVLSSLINSEKETSIVAYDEKSTISMTTKYMINRNFEDIYEFSTMKIHDNSISINLLSYFENDKDLKELFDTICKVEDYNGDHKYWAATASALLFNTAKILKSIKKICELGSFVTSVPIYFDQAVEISGIKKGSVENIQISLTNEPVTLKLIGDFTISNRLYFKAISENARLIIDSLKEVIYTYLPKDISYKSLFGLDKLFDEAYKNAKVMSSYHIEYQDTSGNGPNGIFMSATSSLNETGLCHIDTLNDTNNVQDIIELLEERRRILIIDSDAFPHAATVAVTKILFDNLSMRTRKQHRRPVHILMDEAARIVLSSNLELGKTMAIARESELYLHLCFQAEAQLLKLGEAEYHTVMENATDVYTFSTVEEPMAAHYYKHNTQPNQIFYAEPIYLNRKNMLKAEAKYQKSMNAYSEVEYGDDEVILFDPRLYEKKQSLYAVHYKNNCQRLVHYENTDNIEFDYFRTIIKKKKEREMRSEMRAVVFLDNNEDSEYRILNKKEIQ